MRWAIIDTSVYVGHWQHGEFEDALAAVRRGYVVRQSAVVLSELRRGARTPDAQKLVATLLRTAPVVWAPTPDDWWKAGQLVRVIGDARNWDVTKRREFQNDALIALTARRHGATVVSAISASFWNSRRSAMSQCLASPMGRTSWQAFHQSARGERFDPAGDDIAVNRPTTWPSEDRHAALRGDARGAAALSLGGSAC